MKSKKVKRGAAALFGIFIGTLNAIVLIVFLCLANYYFLRLFIFSISSMSFLVFLIFFLVVFLVLGKIARSLREKSEGADKVAFEALGHVAQIANPDPIPAEETEGNPFLIRLALSILFIALIALIVGVAWYFSIDKWKDFSLYYGIILAIELLIYTWVNPVNRFMNNRVGVGGLSESSE